MNEDRISAFDLSQQRWRGDEPDATLTWGTIMIGDPFVDILASHGTWNGETRLIEIGPGYGRILEAILRRNLPFCRYTGLEVSAARVARLREQYPDPRLFFIEADILAPIELSEPADLVFGAAVFEHFYPDFGAALETISGLLAPDGVVVFDLIREPDVGTTVFEPNGTFIRWYTRREAEEMLRRHGYNPQTAIEISYGLDPTGREIVRTVFVAASGRRLPVGRDQSRGSERHLGETQRTREIGLKEWLLSQVNKEDYWFHRIELAPDLITPGWSDPLKEKLPHFALPNNMTGMRVLDIGCAEGFFSFEAERRGAKEVVAIDSFPDSVRRFNVCRAALDARATAFLTNVYDLSPCGFGTFDLVMFFGVLYHLRNPILALEKIFSICSGTLLLQTHGFEDPAVGDQSMAQFHPFGIESGPPEKRAWDPTIFWIPNAACVRAMLQHVGFQDIEQIPGPAGHVFRARVPTLSTGVPPDQAKAPWN